MVDVLAMSDEEFQNAPVVYVDRICKLTLQELVSIALKVMPFSVYYNYLRQATKEYITMLKNQEDLSI